VTPLAFLDIGFGELVVVAVVGLVLYGGRLPEMMRTFGGLVRKLKRSVEDLSRSVSTPDDRRSAPPRPPAPPAPPAPPTSPSALPRPPPPPPEPSPRRSPPVDDAPPV
jgi:Sec-independent protein translocase protein TatA